MTAVGVMASPASAHSAVPSGSVKCDTEKGQWVVTWTLQNDFNLNAGVTLDLKAAPPNGFLPKGSTLVPDITGQTVPLLAKGATGDTITGKQFITPAKDVTEAELAVKVEWSDKFKAKYDTKVDLPGECKVAVTPPPAPEPPPAAPPAAPPPPAAAAPPTLPKTGSNTLMYGLGALFLGTGGAVLFLIARRRRVKFVA
jgi:LPXTG-motif cell wall-anchored protein